MLRFENLLQAPNDQFIRQFQQYRLACISLIWGNNNKKNDNKNNSNNNSNNNNNNINKI